MAQFNITTLGDTSVCCYHKYDSIHKKNKIYDALFTVLTEEVINDAIKKLAFGIQLPDRYSKVLLLTNYILSNDYNKGCSTNEIDFTCLVPFFNCLNIDISCFMKKLGRCCSEDLTKVECECIDNIPLSLPISYITVTESGTVRTSDNVIFKCCTGDNTITLLGSDTYPLGIIPLNVGEVYNNNEAEISFQVNSTLFSETTTVNYQLLICGQVVIKPIKFIAKPCVEFFTYGGNDPINITLTLIHGESYDDYLVELNFRWSCCNEESPDVNLGLPAEVEASAITYNTVVGGTTYSTQASFTVTVPVIPVIEEVYMVTVRIETCGVQQKIVTLNITAPIP